MQEIKKVDGGVTVAQGFFASGAEAGIKYKNRKDMALVYSKVPRDDQHRSSCSPGLHHFH